MVHKNIFITGQVQGVGFRYSAQRMAKSLGVKGFVKNLNDGRVYIEAEAETGRLNQFISWCMKGTAYSRVRDVDMEDGEFKNYQFFDIKY